MDTPELVDWAGAAQILGCSPRLVRELWQRGMLPGVKVASLVRFDPADLRRYVEARRVEATQGPLAGAR